MISYKRKMDQTKIAGRIHHDYEKEGTTKKTKRKNAG